MPMPKAEPGIAPIAWWNDDLQELGDDVSLQECLRHASVTGFTGMATGRRFPVDMDELGPILAGYDVSVCGGWFSGLPLDGDIEAERDIKSVHIPARGTRLVNMKQTAESPDCCDELKAVLGENGLAVVELPVFREHRDDRETCGRKRPSSSSRTGELSMHYSDQLLLLTGQERSERSRLVGRICRARAASLGNKSK